MEVIATVFALLVSPAPGEYHDTGRRIQTRGACAFWAATRTKRTGQKYTCEERHGVKS